MTQVLIWTLVIYLLIGVAMTAFCVHMSYHEAAIGFGDSDDFKVQKVLESKMGLLGYLFLFTCWPLALIIAFVGRKEPVSPSLVGTVHAEHSPMNQAQQK